MERVIDTPEKIRAFLNGCYGAVNAEGKGCFNPYQGVVFERLHGMGKSPLLSDAVRQVPRLYPLSALTDQLGDGLLCSGV